MSTTSQLETLYALISAVPGLEGTTGMKVGGQGADATVISTPLPAAWIVYAGKTPVEKPINGVVLRGPVQVKNLFVVMLYLDYSVDQNVLASTQVPLLASVVSAVVGKEDSGSPGGFRFNFEGERLASINPKRLTYEMRFSIVSYL